MGVFMPCVGPRQDMRYFSGNAVFCHKMHTQNDLLLLGICVVNCIRSTPASPLTASKQHTALTRVSQRSKHGQNTDPQASTRARFAKKRRLRTTERAAWIFRAQPLRARHAGASMRIGVQPRFPGVRRRAPIRTRAAERSAAGQPHAP